MDEIEKDTEKPHIPSLGRLSALGPKEPWQAALILPQDYEPVNHYTGPFTDLLAHRYEKFTLRCTATSDINTCFATRPARKTIKFADQWGNLIGATWFGEDRHKVDEIKEGDVVIISGRIREFQGIPWFDRPEIITNAENGSVRVTYPGKKGVMGGDRVAEYMERLLPTAIPVAAKWVAEQALQSAVQLGITANITSEQIEKLLWQSHRPESVGKGFMATSNLERIAALATLGAAHKPVANEHKAKPIIGPTLEKRIKAIPFALTNEQSAAIKEIKTQLATYEPQRHLISGDVGTGKTFVFSSIAAINADEGHLGAILLPNQPLAAQVKNEINKTWPDIQTMLITSESKSKQIDIKGGGILIGTTALLTQAKHLIPKINLVIVDEQQKFSIKQRETLASMGAHQIEATATCIPRSLALTKYGAVQMSRLTQPFKKKHIHTYLHEYHERGKVMEAVKKTIRSGNQVIVVYALKQEGEDEKSRKAAKDSIHLWEKISPGRVALITGDMTDEEKLSALQKMKDGEADVLAGTTVVEIGIDLPKVRHVIVADASRLGVTQIHQIRGRAARQGGFGRCDLILPSDAQDRTRERLQILTKTQNGFEVAENDLVIRGFGNLAGGNDAKQSGYDETFLYGRPLDVKVVDEVAKIIEERRVSKSGKR
jgi:ATP-dependent DNA helicase RecG